MQGLYEDSAFNPQRMKGYLLLFLEFDSAINFQEVWFCNSIKNIIKYVNHLNKISYCIWRHIISLNIFPGGKKERILHLLVEEGIKSFSLIRNRCENLSFICLVICECLFMIRFILCFMMGKSPHWGRSQNARLDLISPCLKLFNLK